MDGDKGRKGEWTCTRCTFAENHPIDRNCIQCSTPRFIKYPAISALEIPQVTNPYLEREFTSTEGLPPNANLPSSRHAVPPSYPNDAESDSDTDLYVGENPNIDKSLDFHTPITSSPDLSQHEMDTMADTRGRDSTNVSNQSFYALNAAVATPPISEPTPSSGLPRKFVSVDDFLDQSMTGFKKSDFKKPRKSRQPSKQTNFKLDFSFKDQTESVVTGQNQTEPADTRLSDFMNLTPIGHSAVNPLEPIETAEHQTEPVIGPGSSDFMNLTPIDSPAINPHKPGKSDPIQTESIDPGHSDFMNLSPIVSPAVNPLEPAETGQIQDLFQDRSLHEDLNDSDNFLALTPPPGMSFSPKSLTTTSQPKITQPGNLNSLLDSALIADPPSNSGSSHRLFAKEGKSEDPIPLKKIKPAKSGKPIPILDGGFENERKTHSEIMSLFGHVTFGTPPNEPPPEISSFRSASIKTPPGGASNLDMFDPFAPKRDSELEYVEDHFGKETQVTQETRSPAVSSAPITTSVPIGGARRKTTRPAGLPVVSTTESRPNTSTRGEEMSSSVDPTKWSCPLCTYLNRISAQYCEICHDGRPPWYDGTRHSPILIDPPPITDNPQPSEERIIHQTTGKAFMDGWTCQFCAVTNNPSYPLCQSCGKIRPEGFVSPIEPLALPAVPMSPTSPGTSRNPFGIMRQSSFVEDVGSLTASPLNSTTISNQESIRMTKVKEDLDKSSLTVFQNIKEYCSQTREKFVDDQFFPSVNILQYPGVRNPVIENAIWLRPHELKTDGNFFSTRRWTVFSEEGPRSADIRQGILGNCWFLSALSVLCERAELLYKIFVTNEYNEQGAYMIRLCKDGVWQTLIIDDLLPCSPDGKLIYSQAVRRQLWVPLIEKALAKVHGCYEALQAGRTIEGLATLTGAPCESLQLVTGADRIKPEPDLIWARLLSSKEAGFLMGASCGGATMDVDSTIYDAVNLRVRHAYSVLDVRTERTDEGNHVKLLQLRNPWAQQSWSGMWSDRDQMWDRNPRLKNRLKPNLSHDGIFWINFQDMMFYFDSIDICKVQTGRDLYEVRTQGVFQDSAKVPPTTFFLEVNTSTEIDLSIFQQGSRSVEGSGRHPVDICVCVYRSNATAAASAPGSEVSLGSLVVASRRQVKRHSSCWHWFETGYYQIVTLAFNHWVSAFGGGGAASSSTRIGTEPPKYVLALHSTKEVSISYFRPNTNILADAVFELAVKRGDYKDLRDCATCYYLAHGWAGLIIVAENRHPTHCLQIICDCEESVNVVSTRGRLKTIDCVPPLHRQVLVVLTQLDGHSGFTITHKEVHKMAESGLGNWSVERDHDPRLHSEVSPLHKPRPL